MSDLNEVIEDSITDAELPDTTPEVPDTPEVEAAPDSTPDPVTPEPADTSEVKSPADEKPVDDFDKKYGLQAQSASGRENRIPYSRVKKIADKAVKDAEANWKKSQETGFTPVAKYQELETKVKDYEGRLSQVAQFEQILDKDPAQFLTRLSQHPAYTQFFNRLNELADFADKQGKAQAQPLDSQVQPGADMPQPDHPLPDGTMVYSIDGLRKLQEWNRNQAKQEAVAEAQRILDDRIQAVEAKYGPMAKDYDTYQARQSVLPTVQKQITEARAWPLFNESEVEIATALERNPSWNLERAYQSVVLPKLQANRDTMRADILKEVKQAPRSTTVGGSRVKANPTGGTPQSLEEVIKASLDGINNR
jgi:hypothetical protein